MCFAKLESGHLFLATDSRHMQATFSKLPEHDATSTSRIFSLRRLGFILFAPA